MRKVSSLIITSSLGLLTWALLLSLSLSFSDGCTIGAFGPTATVDGRPILWKNRDVTNPDQEIRYFTGGRFRFVANVYAGETLDVWAGINEKGFGIMNSNSFNLGGRDAPFADDGNVMSLALANCATVADFAKLLDSLNIVGRETPANYGVFDSTGMTAMFEASNTYYTRFNAQDDSLGMLLRANYSLSGSPNNQVGKERWLRAQARAAAARHENRLDARFVLGTLSRDLGTVNFNPYPLPFQGRYRDLDSGCVPVDSTICRAKTRAAFVIVGPRPGGAGTTGMMWVLLGSPIATIPVPVWVNGRATPAPLNGPVRAPICDEAGLVHKYLCSDPDHPTAINTFRLAELLARFARTETTIFSLVARQESLWGTSGPDSTQAFQTTTAACNLTLAAYRDYWDFVVADSHVSFPDTAVRLKPTITRHHLELSWPKDKPVRAIRLYNSVGQLVATHHQPLPIPSCRLELDQLPQGTYFVLLSPARLQSRFLKAP